MLGRSVPPLVPLVGVWGVVGRDVQGTAREILGACISATAW